MCSVGYIRDKRVFPKTEPLPQILVFLSSFFVWAMFDHILFLLLLVVVVTAYHKLILHSKWPSPPFWNR